MTKAELIQSMSEKMGLSTKYASTAVDAFVAAVTDVMKRGDSVTLPGFGTFGVKDKPAAIRNNPRTGGQIEVPARRVAVFRAGKKLKEAAASSFPGLSAAGVSEASAAQKADARGNG